MKAGTTTSKIRRAEIKAERATTAAEAEKKGQQER